MGYPGVPWIRIIGGPEPDYVDGEIVARHLGSIAHADTQDRLQEILRPLRQRFSLYAFPEISLKLSGTHFRVADIAAFAGGKPRGMHYPSEVPALVIEILSEDDRLTEIQKKFVEYKEYGIRHIWLADPWMRKLYIWETGLRDVPSFELPEYGVTIRPADIFDQTPN